MPGILGGPLGGGPLGGGAPPLSPGQGTTTTAPPDPCPSYLPPSDLLIHVKFFPRYNDEYLIQHADDQINSGTKGESLCALGEDSVGDHERIGYPIGSAIESYQGFATCEVFHQHLDIDTDGEPIYDENGDPVSIGGYGLFLSERPCEQVKVLYETPITWTWRRFKFRLRTLEGSANYIDLIQYVYIPAHEVCGSSGGSSSPRCDSGEDVTGGGGGGDPVPPGETTATSTTTTTVTTTTTSSSSTSVSTSASTTASTVLSSTVSTSMSITESTSASSTLSTSASTTLSSSLSSTTLPL